MSGTVIFEKINPDIADWIAVPKIPCLLQNELSSSDHSGIKPGESVLIDALCMTGPAKTRFGRIWMTVSGFDFASLEQIPYDSVPERVRAVACKALKNDPDALERSMLTLRQKKAVKRGGTI